MSLLVSKELWERIRGATELGYPQEACGALIGPPGDDFASPDRGLAVAEVRPLSNAWEEPQRRTRYVVPGDELRAIERELSGTGRAIVGFYHSHPDVAAWPSPFDLERAWPFYSYLIVSVRKGRAGEARAWRLDESGRNFVEEPFKLVEGAVVPSPREAGRG